MALHLEGGCLCGSVRYEVSGRLSEDEAPCLCHCRICQRSTGAPLVAWATFSQEDFKITAGQMVMYRSSSTGRRQFCGQCGTQLVFQTDGSPVLDITVASLDSPDAVQPEAHIWTASKRSYMSTKDLPSFEAKRG